jgi:hypothetical protein
MVCLNTLSVLHQFSSFNTAKTVPFAELFFSSENNIGDIGSCAQPPKCLAESPWRHIGVFYCFVNSAASIPSPEGREDS